jgi:hypothetical protein
LAKMWGLGFRAYEGTGENVGIVLEQMQRGAAMAGRWRQSGAGGARPTCCSWRWPQELRRGHNWRRRWRSNLRRSWMGGGVVQSTLRDRAVFGGVVPSTHALRASSTVHWYIVNYLTHRKRDEKHLNKVVFLKP